MIFAQIGAQGMYPKGGMPPPLSPPRKGLKSGREAQTCAGLFSAGGRGALRVFAGTEWLKWSQYGLIIGKDLGASGPKPPLDLL